MRLTENFFDSLQTIPIEKLPDLELYIDQVTTFLDSKLDCFKRGSDDKAITKTMVNNYTKAKMLPVSNKKKYNQNHLIHLILIYHLKSVLSIEDISKIIQKIPADSIESFYEAFLKIQENEISRVQDTFRQENENNILDLICSLAFEIELKKLLIEYIIDSYNPVSPSDTIS